MAVAQHINIYHPYKNNQNQSWKLLQLSVAIVKRIWWHTYAYTTVFKILLLIFASLGFLCLHWLWSRLLPFEISWSKQGYFFLYNNRPTINCRANSISPLKRTETGKAGN